jgi:hypothetical protein
MSTPMEIESQKKKTVAVKSSSNMKIIIVVVGILGVAAIAAIVGVVLVLPGGGATTAASPSSPPPPGPPPAPPAPIPATAVAATNIALAGTYLTNFGSYITVNDGTWYTVASYGTSMYHIHAFEGSYIIAQNSANNSYNAGQWSKFEFHATSGGGYGYCQSVYNAATANAAYNTDTSSIYNAADASAGCNGFGHSTMAPYAMPMIGSWTTNFGSNLTVTASAWTSVSSYGTSTYRIEAYGNNYILAQNSASNSYNPSLWSLFRFHATSGGSYGFCQIVYNGATAPAALTGDVSAYNASNAASGCNGFGHTIATRA